MVVFCTLKSNTEICQHRPGKVGIVGNWSGNVGVSYGGGGLKNATKNREELKLPEFGEEIGIFGQNIHPCPEPIQYIHGCQDLEKLVFPDFSRFSLIKMEKFP